MSVNLVVAVSSEDADFVHSLSNLFKQDAHVSLLVRNSLPDLLSIAARADTALIVVDLNSEKNRLWSEQLDQILQQISNPCARLLARFINSPDQQATEWLANKPGVQILLQPDLEAAIHSVRDGIRTSFLLSIQHIALTGAVTINECRTIADLGLQALSVLDQMGIAPDGGIFAVSHSVNVSAEQNILVVGGTGQFASLAGKNLDHIGDEKIKSALTMSSVPPDGHDLILRKQSHTDESIVFYLPRSKPLGLIQQASLQAFIQAASLKFDQLYSQERALRLQRATVVSLAYLAEYKDTDTGDHVLRVARLTDEIAWTLYERGHVENFGDVPFDQIGVASILHDVGKIAIPERILLKPGPLDDDERHTIETHTVLGSDVLARSFQLAEDNNYLKLGHQIARWHHEWYNGKGYPDKLSGDQIPLAARIVAIVDVFDALTNKRPYKEPWPLQKAIDFICERAGSQFDPKVVEAFLLIMEKRSLIGMIEWTPEMSVGNAAIDHDHQNLIALFNQLGLSQIVGNRHVVSWVLDEMVNYTLSHFRREEALLEKYNYRGLENHRRIHHDAMTKIKDIRQQYNLGLRDHIETELIAFLSNWLSDHILGEDRKYIPAIHLPPEMLRAS
jgi:hemerythrin-like metal-binding protein